MAKSPVSATDVPMELAITIDVEEEGLFRKSYESRTDLTGNVECLAKLDHVFRKHGIKPTLFVSYAVAVHSSHRAFLSDLARQWGAEIGIHLHHWNTPPLEPLPFPQPTPSELIPVELLRAKFNNVLDVVREMNPNPVSFRMGRFNLGAKMFRVLEDSPIQVDSSIAPLRTEYGGPDHLTAPSDPYFPDSSDPRRPGHSRILEVPITIVPIYPGIGSLAEWISSLSQATKYLVRPATKYLASLSAQPMATGLRRLKAAARLHQARQGRTLTLYFHSSELLPGGCPQHNTEADVTRFIDKIDAFLDWAIEELEARPLVMSKLRDLYDTSFADSPAQGSESDPREQASGMDMKERSRAG
ncbi:MAG: hypothetical protein AB1733_18235 [Thermodesulfobacteriota bacterium]